MNGRPKRRKKLRSQIPPARNVEDIHSNCIHTKSLFYLRFWVAKN